MTSDEMNRIHSYGGGICANCDVEIDQIEEGGLLKFVCPECGYKVDCSEYEYEGDDCYVDPDEERMPGGCVACGNPAYPDCMTSCSRFDD